MIKGINHLTLSVSDLEASTAFYQEVLGFKLLARWPKGRYFLAGDLWLALILDDKVRTAPLPEYSHVAFGVSEDNFEALSEQIRDSGAEIFQPNASEGLSLYFLDPDGHKLEVHASTLEARLASMRVSPWEGLELLV